LDGEPSTVARLCDVGRGSVEEDVDDWVPNFHPPESLRRFFFEKEVSRRSVAKPPPPERGEPLIMLWCELLTDRVVLVGDELS
jgi:hypothetical protein